MSSDFQFIMIAAFGSAVQEIIHLYDIRNRLHLPEISDIIKSWKYWIITLVMILASGIGTWILYGKDLKVMSVIFILGAAFPLIFKKLIAGLASSTGTDKKIINETKLGGFSVKDYFK